MNLAIRKKNRFHDLLYFRMCTVVLNIAVMMTGMNYLCCKLWTAFGGMPTDWERWGKANDRPESGIWPTEADANRTRSHQSLMSPKIVTYLLSCFCLAFVSVHMLTCACTLQYVSEVESYEWATFSVYIALRWLCLECAALSLLIRSSIENAHTERWYDVEYWITRLNESREHVSNLTHVRLWVLNASRIECLTLHLWPQFSMVESYIYIFWMWSSVE